MSRSPLIASLTVILILLAGCAHDRGAETVVNGSGRHLYSVYCSSCHGLDARGAGPAQPYIAADAPDLTRIAARNSGSFPKEKVFRTIDGVFDTPAPGTRHMPVWDYELFTGEGDDETAHQQVLDVEHRIVDYLASIQDMTPGPQR
jgi:hypothetical protein